jgi:hypothetical protein
MLILFQDIYKHDRHMQFLLLMLPTKFRFIWPSSFRGGEFKKMTNQKKELPVAAMFVNGSG